MSSLIETPKSNFHVNQNLKGYFTITIGSMLTSIILWLSFIFLITSCEPVVEPTRNFVIYKGDHYAQPKIIESIQSQSFAFEARFDESAVYDLGDIALQSNKNKLLGLSDCNSLHHENSARFAWQWFNNRLEIFGYCYVNGERQESFIGIVNLNEFNRYEIKIQKDSYVFILNDLEPVTMHRGNVCDLGVYYKLWPYFGGSVAAPHDVHIEIKMKY